MFVFRNAKKYFSGYLYQDCLVSFDSCVIFFDLPLVLLVLADYFSPKLEKLTVALSLKGCFEEVCP